MSEGCYAAGEEGSKYSWLDEFLCEYVDGTMDPATQAAFEEYLAANPELEEHVACLRRTRHLLCRYGCQLEAPRGLQARLRLQLACETVRAPLFSAAAARLGKFALYSSVMLSMLLAGMLVGLTLVSGEGIPDGKAAFAGKAASGAAEARSSQVKVPSRPRYRTYYPIYSYPVYSNVSVLSSMPLPFHTPRDVPAGMQLADSLGKEGLQRTAATP